MVHDFELEPATETRQLVELIRRRSEPAPGRVATSPKPTTASMDQLSDIIAVLPFSVHGTARYAYLGEGMVDLLATKLGKSVV